MYSGDLVVAERQPIIPWQIRDVVRMAGPRNLVLEHSRDIDMPRIADLTKAHGHKEVVRLQSRLAGLFVHIVGQSVHFHKRIHRIVHVQRNRWDVHIDLDEADLGEIVRCERNKPAAKSLWISDEKLSVAVVRSGERGS